jgi:hypothetical protein
MVCDMPDEYAIRQNVELGLHKKTHASQLAELNAQKACVYIFQLQEGNFFVFVD